MQLLLPGKLTGLESEKRVASQKSELRVRKASC